MRTQKVFTVALVVFIAGTVFLASLMAAHALPVQDLSQYWAAAHLVSQNPYSLPATREFERSAGVYTNLPTTKIPPWAIMMVMPLGLLGYYPSFALWSLMSVVIVTACARAVWQGTQASPSLEPAILSLIFGPTIVLLMLGQFTVLVLLGVILFWCFVEKKQDWYAGASLLLLFGKPHVVLIFLIAVAFWAVQTRRWIIFLSGFLSLAAASLTAFIINPHIYSQFWERTVLVVNETESYPNLGGMLYVASGLHRLALVPQLLGLIWFGFYWRTHRLAWKWQEHGMMVLLCSVVCSYYSYPYEEVLALPALLYAYANGNRRIFLLVFTLTNIGYALYISGIAGHIGYGYMFLWWTAAGWLLTCVLAQSRQLSSALAYKPSV